MRTGPAPTKRTLRHDRHIDHPGLLRFGRSPPGQASRQMLLCGMRTRMFHDDGRDCVVINRIVQVLMAMLAMSSASPSETPDLASVRTMEELDKLAVFRFAIMSDNKGDSPKNSIEFARMVKWIEEGGDKFVVGLGDHVLKGVENPFLQFLSENRWWREHFYPNVADGENEYYGSDQADWGAGRKIFDAVNLRSRDWVSIRPNGAEYYAKIGVNGYTVHLVQLSYPDEPPDPEIAFRPDSRRYLVETIQAIKKGEKDIIVACAHTCYGSWIGLLSDEQRKVVMEKADLVLSATTHIFMRIPVEGYEDRGALCLNTGSISYPRFFFPPGYVEVHVVEKPLRLVVQYIRADGDRRELQSGDLAWLKYASGRIAPAGFTIARPAAAPASQQQ